MVTSNKLPEKKFVTMAAQNPSAVVPQRTLLGEVNEHITCPLCRGYYIDATTIVECLHSFCRSCIIKHLQVKSYCPVCEMMINSAKPNIKLDKALQDIVYKLVPGLFQKEMERRQQFYSSRPGPAASATPEQRGEDTERIIFSPEDVISFSLEYADLTDSDSISSKSSDSNEPQPTTGATRRFLQCPAVVNISHLKKFLSMKFDIDSTQFAIDILYKRVPLPDYYTLMDIAYIYNWKRNEPMRFFYQIIDYIAIRNRIFDINRKGSHFRDRKSSPTSTEDTNVSSPAPNLNDHGSEGSSGADSPMPDDSSIKQANDTTKKCDKTVQQNKSEQPQDNANLQKNVVLAKKNDDEVEKSQFLNSFELTAKSNNVSTKASPTKSSNSDTTASQAISKTPIFSPKVEDSLKRKQHTTLNAPEMKKLKVELEKTKIPPLHGTSANVASTAHQNLKTSDVTEKSKDSENNARKALPPTNSVPSPSIFSTKEIKPQPIATTTTTTAAKQISDNPSIKRTVSVAQNNISAPKHKHITDIQSPTQSHPPVHKTVSPLKLQVPKLETQMQSPKTADIHKPLVKKMPDLKPSSLASQSSQNKNQHVNKVRMDLLANNSDPTIDRSKILSQVKSSLSQNTLQNSGDPLKSIFDSCNINIPSSLSITLTDQKLDCRNPNEGATTDQKKNIINKNLSGISSTPGHKVPSPPVHNYIEILKLPETDNKTLNKVENISDMKVNTPNKSDGTNTQPKVPSKSSETSAKGPVPNLKPIADTKIGKHSAPITFQQTFEQQLQSLQTDKKPKLPKTKTQVPKLVPAPKVFNAANKTANLNKPNTGSVSTEPKPSSALDLSTPHNIQSQVLPQQTFDKALETMQSIANLAKKQNLPSKGLPLTSMAQTNAFSCIPNRPLTSGVSSIRIPTSNNANQMKHDKPNPHNPSIRHEVKSNQLKPTNTPTSSITPPTYQIGSNSHSSTNAANTAQPSPRSQTRSPSSSPKLVIAEEKQASSSSDQSGSQVVSLMNPQIPVMHSSKNESPKPLPGPSKSGLKQIKPSTPTGKVPGIRPALTLNPTTMNTSAEYMTRPQVMSAHHALLRHQMDAWIKVQRQFDLMKSMSNLAHPSQNDFNNKDK